MKKAVIQTGSKQYLVQEGETLEVELVKEVDKKKLSFEPLLVLDGEAIKVGTPHVANAKVEAAIVELDKQSDKVTAIRYKSKKRVHKVRGHRQHKTVLKISKIQ